MRFDTMKFHLDPIFRSLRCRAAATLAVGVLGGLSALAGVSTTAQAAAAVDAGASATDASAAIPASEARVYKTPTWTTYYGDIDAIRADSAKAQAELDNLKIHHQLDEARHGNFSTNDSPTPLNQPSALPMMAGANALAQSLVSPAAHDPLVEQVSMVDNRWTAVIRLPSGARVSAHEGQTVRGVGKITTISLNEVVASEGTKTTALQFAGDQEPEPAAATTSQAAHATPMPFGMR
jgi:type IV pilus biogenesis protein PilP